MTLKEAVLLVKEIANMVTLMQPPGTRTNAYGVTAEEAQRFAEAANEAQEKYGVTVEEASSKILCAWQSWAGHYNRWLKGYIKRT